MADEPKVTVFPQVSFPSTKRSEGGNLVVQVRTNAKEVAEVAAALRTRVGSAILSDADQRAAFIQQKLRAAVLGAYTKAATGRMSRGIFATATKVGSPEGGVKTVIRVTMFNYREANFITNLGGRGYFSRFPVGPYRIFAQGVEGALALLAPFRRRNSLRSSRRTISLLKQHGVGRLKVPRRSAFFTATRRPGRGGGESRTIGDTSDGDWTDAWIGTLKGLSRSGEKSASFFYPLWVNHPGFHEDVITQVALEEGARFTQEVPGEVAAVSANIPVVKPSVQFRGGGFVYKAPVSSQLVINKQQTSRRIR